MVATTSGLLQAAAERFPLDLDARIGWLQDESDIAPDHLRDAYLEAIRTIRDALGMVPRPRS